MDKELSLYGLNQNLLKAMTEIDAAYEVGEEPSTEALELFRSTIKDMTVKVDNCYKFNCFIESQKELIKQERDRLANKAKSLENLQDRFKNYLKDIAKSQGGALEGSLYKVGVQSRDSVEIISEDQIPEEYRVTEVVTKIDKRSILKALKSLVEVPGASLKSNEFITFK